MVKSKIMRATAVAVTSLGAVAACAGIAGASAGTLDTTGPNSTNVVKSITKLHTQITNKNHLSVQSNNSQGASSGDAVTVHNTTAGDATTGDAKNSNAVGATVQLTNSMPDMTVTTDNSDNTGNISNTGPDSSNTVLSVTKSSLKVTNTNSVTVASNSEQDALTGKAVVAGNTTGGSATSGAASNSNSDSVSITINN